MESFIVKLIKSFSREDKYFRESKRDVNSPTHLCDTHPSLFNDEHFENYDRT